MFRIFAVLAVCFVAESWGDCELGRFVSKKSMADFTITLCRYDFGGGRYLDVKTSGFCDMSFRYDFSRLEACDYRRY